MLWRVRTTLPDRPGTLAGLARTCGEAGVDIRALQIFPAAGAAGTVGPIGEGGPVTDELVLETSEDLDRVAVVALVQSAGGSDVLALRCSEAALSDQPTRFVEAARSVIAAPASFPDVVAHLFDADTEVSGDQVDVLELSVAAVRVQIRRAEPFTATEHERGRAIAALVDDVLARERVSDGPDGRLGAGVEVTFVVLSSGVEARAGDLVVGHAHLLPVGTDDPGARGVDLAVDPAWQRRGLGTRLLSDAARLARGLGAEELLIRTEAANQAVMPMVLSANMRGRIRMAGDVLTVRIPLREIRPLPVSA